MSDKYVARTAHAFDPARTLVAARPQLIMGVNLNPGDELPEELDHGVKLRLWMTRWVDYAEDLRPTPVEEAAPAAPVEAQDEDWMAEASGVSVEKGAAGWFTITASWLAEPVKERGEEAAKAKASELRAEGAPPPADEAGDDTGE